MDGRTITDHMILDKVDIAEKRIYVFMFRHMSKFVLLLIALIVLFVIFNTCFFFCYAEVMKLLSVGQGCSRLLQEIQVVWKHPKRSFGHHCEPSLYISEVRIPY